MENIKRFSYKDTDKKIEIEIYGLRFTINKNVIINKDIKEINGKEEDKILKEIDEILGTGAVEKINNQREKDGHDKMDINVQLAVLGCIYETYINATINDATNGMLNSYNEKLKEMNNLGNRKYRRNYNRGRRCRRY